MRDKSEVHISAVVVDQLRDRDHIELEHKLIYDKASDEGITFSLHDFVKSKHVVNDMLLFQIKQIRVI